MITGNNTRLEQALLDYDNFCNDADNYSKFTTGKKQKNCRKIGNRIKNNADEINEARGDLTDFCNDADNYNKFDGSKTEDKKNNCKSNRDQLEAYGTVYRIETDIQRLNRQKGELEIELANLETEKAKLTDTFSNMEKVTKIILNPRVSDTTFTYTDFAEGETLDKASLTLEDSFKSFMHKADPAIGTTLFYIPWNKDTYIHSVKDNKHHKLFHATSDKVEAKSINKDGADLDAIYSHENNNKMVEHDLYHGKSTYQITGKFHFDITNGALLHNNNGELKIYNRAGSVVETIEATSVEEKGFEPFVVKDVMNYLDVVYIPHGVNTMIVVLGKYLGEITLLNVIRFTPEGVVNIKSGQASCVNENPESATVVNNEEEGDGKYILKTQIVPPVCPTCPTCPSCCNSDKKDTCTSCGGNGGNGTKNQ